MMNTTCALRWWLLPVLALAVASVGCDSEPDKTPAKETKESKTPVKQVRLFPDEPNVVFEVEGKQRRVLLKGAVCMREGPLELLVTIKGKKEHEAVVAVEVDARNVHRALLAADAKEGSPVRFQPKYVPASGTPIKVFFEYEEKPGKTVRVPAQQWVRNSKTKKLLDTDWVFAGSRLVANPLDPDKKIYLANEGDLICVSNFESALLDLPIASTKDNDDLSFEINTDLVPERDTKVTVILEPVLEKKK